MTETVRMPKEMPGDYWRKKEWSLWDKLKTLIRLKKMTPEFLEILKRLAWELANVFSHATLAASTIKSNRRNQANEVHAYILLHYPLIYRKLIFDNRVIDLACLYAKRDFNPDMLTKIPLKELQEYQSSLVLIDPYTLKNFPMVTFNKVIVYTKNEFYDSIARENEASIEWNEWDTIGIRLPFNASLMAFISYDIPMWFVTHTPGKNTMFYEGDFDDVEKQHEKEMILTKAYHQAQIDLIKTEKLLDKTTRLAESYGRMISDVTKEAERQRKKDFRAEIDRIEREKEEERIKITQKPSKIKQLLPLLIIVAIITGTLFALWMIFTFTYGGLGTVPNSTASSTFIHLFNKFKVMF